MSQVCLKVSVNTPGAAKATQAKSSADIGPMARSNHAVRVAD